MASQLLPSNDAEKHAKVMQMLHFDATVFWPAVKALTFPYLLRQGAPPQGGGPNHLNFKHLEYQCPRYKV